MFSPGGVINWLYCYVTLTSARNADALSQIHNQDEQSGSLLSHEPVNISCWGTTMSLWAF